MGGLETHAEWIISKDNLPCQDIGVQTLLSSSIEVFNTGDFTRVYICPDTFVYTTGTSFNSCFRLYEFEGFNQFGRLVEIDSGDE